MSQRSARRRDLRLVPVVVVTWIVAGTALVVPHGAGVIAAGAATSSVCLLVLAARRVGGARSLWAISAVACAFAAATAAHVGFAEPPRAQALALPVDGGRALAVEALVVGKVERSGAGWRFDAVTRTVAIGTDTHTLAVPISVRVDEVPAALDLGAEVHVVGSAFRADAGQRAVLIVRGTTSLTVRAPPSGVWAAASELRRGLQRAVSGLPLPAAGLIAGLSVGDTSQVGVELDADMKAASLSHLTAVSGANCALVVGIAFAAAAAAGARRAARVGAGVGALVGFVVLVSPEPSVVRAATMAAIAMVGVLLGRIGAGVSILCAAVVTLLVVDPWLASSLGFALSAVATGSLLLLAGPLADGLARWMPAPLALALSIPLAAQLACGPLLILVSPTVPLHGVLANLLAGPAAPAGTVLGLLACLSAPVPVLAHGLAALAWIPAAWVAGTAELAASLPAATLPWWEGAAGVVALLLAGAAVVVLTVVREGWQRTRRAAFAYLAVVTGITVWSGPLGTLVDRAHTPREWAIVACDIGQGDAVLVRSAGRVALIDTGPDPDLLTTCLDRFAVTRIDLLVLTHYDLDHRGGLAAVVGRVTTVVHGPPDAPDDAAALESLRAAGAVAVPAQAGMSGELGESRWMVLWAPGASSAYRGNDASVVVEFDGGGVPRTILLGDLSAAPQGALAATAHLSAPYDVVKVAHHGSADQDPRLYARLAARIALLTVGDNDYGHPRAETLEVVQDTGARILRTDVSGAVAIWRGDGHLRFWRERVDAPG